VVTTGMSPIFCSPLMAHSPLPDPATLLLSCNRRTAHTVPGGAKTKSTRPQPGKRLDCGGKASSEKRHLQYKT
jgi:hypothetical protein